MWLNWIFENLKEMFCTYICFKNYFVSSVNCFQVNVLISATVIRKFNIIMSTRTFKDVPNY